MAIVLKNPCPTQDESMWLKGTLHLHTTRSDGRLAPQDVIDRYAALGCGFLALSDHDTLSDYSGLDDRGMVLLPANEVSLAGRHVLHIGASSPVPSSTDTARVLAEIAADTGFSILCHPSWTSSFNHYTFEALMELEGYCGIEIYNHTCLFDAGSAYAVDKWDRLLLAGRTPWGYACDDMHRPENVGGGFNVVRVRERTPAAVIEALRTGCFFATTGPMFERIETDGPRLLATAPGAEEMVLRGRGGRRMLACVGDTIEFDAGDVADRVVRVEAWGRGDRRAWSQPIVVVGGRGEQSARLAAQTPVLRAERGSDLGRPLAEVVRDWCPGKPVELLDIYTMKPASVQTAFACLVDDAYLILCVCCSDPAGRGLHTMATDADPTRIWSDDSMEVFLGVPGEELSHVVVNAAGFVVIPKTSMERGAVECVVVREERGAGWRVAIRFPRSELGNAKRLDAHLCRNRPALESMERYVWSWVEDSNHNRSMYGAIEIP